MAQFFDGIGQFFSGWFNQLYETFIVDDNWLMLLSGLKNTIIITLGALAIGFFLGVAISVIKFLAEDKKGLRPIAKVCDFYVTAVRGIPVVVLLLIFYFLIMRSSEGVIVGIVTFGINSGAYMAEIIRGGIAAVDEGQTEAGRSLGFGRVQTMFHIVLPQAIKNILPSIVNEMIALLKETSVAGYVAVQDLTRAANLIRNNTYDAFNPLIITAVVYLVLVVLMTKALRKLELRLRVSDAH